MYRTDKIFQPIMNFFTIGLSDRDGEDVAADDQFLGKPAFTSPFVLIVGDEDEFAGCTHAGKLVKGH